MEFTPFIDVRCLESCKHICYQEVLEFLRQNNAVNIPWVAIDDLEKHYPENIKIIVTNADEGFSENDGVVLELCLQNMSL